MAIQAGRDVKIYFDTSADHSPAVWALIGKQRGGDLELSADSADATHKDDDGWASGVITRRAWTLSFDGALDPSDTVLQAVKDAFEAGDIKYFKIDRSAISGTDQEGQARITSFNEQFGVEDLVTYSITLEGNGPLVDL